MLRNTKLLENSVYLQIHVLYICLHCLINDFDHKSLFYSFHTSKSIYKTTDTTGKKSCTVKCEIWSLPNSSILLFQRLSTLTGPQHHLGPPRTPASPATEAWAPLLHFQFNGCRKGPGVGSAQCPQVILICSKSSRCFLMLIQASTYMFLNPNKSIHTVL